MPYVHVAAAPSRTEFEAIAGSMQGETPAGQILMSAGELPDGTVQIISIWESPAAAQTFEREVLFPRFEAAGMLEQAMAGPQPVAYEPFAFIR